MALYKRGEVWYTQLIDPKTGTVLKESTKTKDEEAAKLIHELRKQAMAIPVTAVTQKSSGPTVADMMKQYLLDRAKCASFRNQQRYADWIVAQIGDIKLADLTVAMLSELGAKKRAESGVPTGNRTMSVLRAALRSAELDWGMIERAPRIKMAKESNLRDRYLKKEEIAKLIAELPDHQKDIVAFALATGLRQGNVVGLRWEWVDMAAETVTVPSTSFKTRQTKTIPLGATAVEILKRQAGKHQTHVFTYLGERVRQVNTKAWKAALERAGIKDFRWHDLRHTFATHHIQAGTPDSVLQELGGWESPAMLKRYAHHTSASLKPYQKNAPV